MTAKTTVKEQSLCRESFDASSKAMLREVLPLSDGKILWGKITRLTDAYPDSSIKQWAMTSGGIYAREKTGLIGGYVCHFMPWRMFLNAELEQVENKSLGCKFLLVQSGNIRLTFANALKSFNTPNSGFHDSVMNLYNLLREKSVALEEGRPI